MTPDLLSAERALALVLAEVRPLAVERVSLPEARGRVLAHALRAPRDLPAESASLMDGYAVRACEVVEGHPLVIAFELPAGRSAPRALDVGECARIFTGAPIPFGADAVVMQEDADCDGARVRFTRVPAPGDHVRPAASDARAGDELLCAGDVLDAGGLALAAALGLAFVDVSQRPTVAILATGDELRVAGEPLSAGLTYESNTFGLAAQAEEAGARAVVLGIAPDRPDEIAHRLAESSADVVVTSGGAAGGDFDFAREVLERLGGRKVFWQVKIRPGRPVLFGVLARGPRAPVLFFALPGNPAASALTFDQFVRPALRALQRARTVRRPRVEAVLSAPLRKPPHLTGLVRGRLVARGSTLHFEPSVLQGSMSIPSLSQLGAVAILPEGINALEAGDRVVVEPWMLIDAG